MDNQLSGRTVFITGSAGVLGSTYVRRMLAAGARVVSSDLPGHRADALQDEHKGNDNFRFYDLDVGDEAGCEAIFMRIMGDGWEPNVILNNAAITGELLMGAGKPFPDFANTSVSDWERTLRTNLTGAFMIARQMDRDIVGKYPAFNNHSDEFQRRVGELIMAGRMAAPDEIADAMLFLCSAQAGYMTGQLVNVDGGFSGW